MKEKIIARVVVAAFLLIGISIISYVGIYVLFIKGVIGIVAVVNQAINGYEIDGMLTAVSILKIASVPIFIQLSIAFLIIGPIKSLADKI